LWSLTLCFMAKEQVRLVIAGRALTFTPGTARVEACRPPHVPVPKPGPCRGLKVGDGAKVGKAPKRGKGASVRSRLEGAIASGVKTRRRLGRGAVSDVQLVTYNDGTQAVEKLSQNFEKASAKGQTDAEELAVLVAKALGVRVPETVRTGPKTVVMEYLPDDPATGRYTRADMAELAQRGVPDAVRIGLLDVLTRNQDRHMGNVLVGGDRKRLTAIDQGDAWQAQGIHGKGVFGGVFTEDANPLTAADVDEVARRLEELRPEFERLGRGKWYAASVKELDWVRERAAGKKRVIS